MHLLSMSDIASPIYSLSSSTSLQISPGLEAMLKTNLKGKYDNNVNVVRKRGNVRQEQSEKRDVMTDTNPQGKYDEGVKMGNVYNGVNNVEKCSRQLTRPMGEPVIESFGDTAFENSLDKDPGKDKGHEKPELEIEKFAFCGWNPEQNDDVMTDINPEEIYDEEKIAAEDDLQHSAR
jgi:hypothetical protein